MTSNKPTIATESASPTAMGAWRTWRSWQYRGGLGQHILTLYGAQGFGRWLGRGFWAVTDQGLFAVSNFALNVLLARWLTPQDYGAFAIAFAVFLLLGTFHSALLIEPMLVFGPGRYRRRLSEYVGVLLYGHSGFAVLGSLVLLLAGVGVRLAGAGGLSAALWSLAVACPFILFLWLMRRACYIRLEPQLAASGGVLYLTLMVVGVCALYQRQGLSAVSALGVMGCSSLAAGLWLAIRLHVGQPPVQSGGLCHEVLGDHWDYGRWAVASSTLSWASSNICYLLLPVWGGLEASAAFKALMNLLMPLLQANTAFSALLVPTLVRARRAGGFGRLVRLALALFTLDSAFYGVLLGLFHPQLMTWLYGGQYQEYAHVLWPLGFSLLVSGAIDVLGAALRALERPDRIFWVQVLGAVVTLTLGLGFMAAWGVVGAGMGLLLSAAVRALALWAYYQRLEGTRSFEGEPHVVGTTQVL